MKFSNDIDIVVFALARWDAPYSSTAYSLAKEMSKTNRVFYVDNPFTITDVIRRFWSRQVRNRIWSLIFRIKSCRPIPGKENFYYVIPPIVLPINFLSRGWIYDSLLKFNNMMVSSVLIKVLRRENATNFVYLNIFNPFYFTQFNECKPMCRIYYCVDNINESKYINKHGVHYEQKAVGQSNFTISTSKFLQKQMAAYTQKSYYLPNAADFHLFNSAGLIKSRPREINLITSRIIGYIGNIEDRIDFELISQVIRLNTDMTFIFIGPINTKSFVDFGLNSLNNVLAIGKRQMSELPQYLHFFDCAIIPFKKNKLTEGIYPLKINEYLAAGCPVVCTPFSEDIMDFKDVIQIADSPEDFSLAIANQINGATRSNRDARIQRARLNTWEQRVETFKSLLLTNCKLVSPELSEN